MFTCDVCKKTVKPHTPAKRIVVKTRPKRYPIRKDAIRKCVDGKIKLFDDQGGFGIEIVKEVQCCPECAATFVRDQPN